MPEGSRSKIVDSSVILATTTAALGTVLQKFPAAAAYGGALHTNPTRPFHGPRPPMDVSAPSWTAPSRSFSLAAATLAGGPPPLKTSADSRRFPFCPALV